MPEWLKGADCKSAGFCLRWFKSSSAQFVIYFYLIFSRKKNRFLFEFTKTNALFFIFFKKKASNFSTPQKQKSLWGVKKTNVSEKERQVSFYAVEQNNTKKRCVSSVGIEPTLKT